MNTNRDNLCIIAALVHMENSRNGGLNAQKFAKMLPD